MSYLREFGLRFNPFDKARNSEEEIFQSRDLTRMQDAITECIHQRQMLVITGPRGAGKTTAADAQLESAPGELLKVKDFGFGIEYLSIENITEGLIRDILIATKSTEHLFRTRNARLHQLRRILGQFAQQHEVVVFLEDGHKMKNETLVNLKRLRELRFAMQERLLSIVVLAQPQMKQKLEDLEEVFLRCQVVELEGLSNEEVRGYVEFKLGQAGGTVDKIFSPEAMDLIANSVHWPLDINSKLSLLLKECYDVGATRVTRELCERHLTPHSSLYGLWMMSGLSADTLRRELNRKKLQVPIHRVRQILHGRVRVPEVEAALRETMLGTAGASASFFESVAPGITASERGRLERLHERIFKLGDAFDLVQIAQTAKLSQRRAWEVTQGENLTERDLVSLERAIGEVERRRKVA